MILDGGTNIYDVPIGVLRLESYFAKPPGHIKNAGTFDFPLCFKVVKGATTKKVVDQADRLLLQPFMAAAQELELFILRQSLANLSTRIDWPKSYRSAEHRFERPSDVLHRKDWLPLYPMGVPGFQK